MNIVFKFSSAELEVGKFLARSLIMLIADVKASLAHQYAQVNSSLEKTKFDRNCQPIQYLLTFKTHRPINSQSFILHHCFLTTTLELNQINSHARAVPPAIKILR